MFEDVAVVDEFPELGERDVEGCRGRHAMAGAPLRDGADAVLVIRYMVRDGVIGRRHAEREVVLQYPADPSEHLYFDIVAVARAGDGWELKSGLCKR